MSQTLLEPPSNQALLSNESLAQRRTSETRAWRVAVVSIPDKPNHTKPQSRPAPAEVERAKAVLASMSIIKNEDATPEQLYVLPITSNQDYGFYHKPLIEKQKLFEHPRSGCDVTLYADAYYTMTGVSPYARKNGGTTAA